ncbi:hypothetical protein GR268_46125, partial [Rhizobium leguminosarum]|nr:hypothetical protein [Rhizobium leguminosarum]
DPFLTPDNPARKALNKLKEATEHHKQNKRNKKIAKENFKKFKKPQEAFLAMMIQIGELSTNKNLSKFVRGHTPNIPWDSFAYLRNALRHQDEWGTTDYFTNLIDGTNTFINFKKWQNEMGILARRVSELKKKIWGNNPQAVCDSWLNAD